MPKRISYTSSDVNVTLNLIQFEEDGLFFVYSPALDVTGYGSTLPAAHESYQLAMTELLNHTATQKTMVKVFRNLGWTVIQSEGHRKLTPPSLSTLIKNRSSLAEILNDKDFHKIRQNITIRA